MVVGRMINNASLAVAITLTGAGYSASHGADARSRSDAIARAPTPTNAVVKVTVVGKGEVAWDELLRQSASYLGRFIRLDCQQVGAAADSNPARLVSSPRPPEGDAAGRYFYRMGGWGTNECRLVSASWLDVPTGTFDVSLTGIWTRFGTNWMPSLTPQTNASLDGLRLATVTLTNRLGPPTEVLVGCPLHPEFESPVSDLLERTRKLVEVLTSYEAGTARQRFAKLFPSPTPMKPTLPAEIQKQVDEGFGPNETPDGRLLETLLRLHESLEIMSRTLREPKNDRSFVAGRVRVIDEVTAALVELDEGPLPGCVELERFRFWYICRLITLGDLLEAQSALGKGSAPLALDSTTGATYALLRHLGQPMPEFEIAAEDGARITSESLRGKWGVLYFKTSDGPSAWGSYYRNFIKLLESMEAREELQMTHVVVPLDKNRGAAWLDKLLIRTEPQILVISPGGHLCYFNSPWNPQIPQADVFRVWLLGRPGGQSRVSRILETLGIDPMGSK